MQRPWQRVRVILSLALLGLLLPGPAAAQHQFPPVKGTVPDPPEAEKEDAETEQPAEPKEEVSPAQAFLNTLSNLPETRDARREAWDALQEADAGIPRRVLAAVDGVREKAWRRMRALIESAPVRRVGRALRRQIEPHQDAALAAIRGGGFTREKLDQAMEPIMGPYQAALDALHSTDAYAPLRDVIHEFESYAAEGGLRIGWHEELRDALIGLLLVTEYVGGSATRELVARNIELGRLIGPGEEACVARLNTHRLLLGIRPAEIDLRLVIAAKKHSEEMVEKNYFAHNSPTPELSSPWKRASREGTGAGGECIAGGGSGVGVFRMWYYSQGHHKIMINGSTVGVGRKNGKWTLMVGGSKLRGAQAERYAAYVRRRYRAEGDPARLLKLAKWCASNHLLTQARDALQRLLAIDPDHAEAKKALAAMSK